jgi:hypothetical protein
MQISTAAENLQTQMIDFPVRLIVQRERERERESVCVCQKAGYVGCIQPAQIARAAA